MKRVLCIVNAAAAGGRGLRRWEESRALLEATTLSVSAVFSGCPGEARDLAGRMAGAHDVVVAAGGDGTVNEVVDGLARSGARAVFAVLPMGTGNDVAHMLGLGDLAVAVRVLERGLARDLDLIEVTCEDGGRPSIRYALIFASVGFAGALLRRTTPWMKRVFGPRGCYSAGLFRALPGFRAPWMRVEWDGKRIEGRQFLACAANAAYAGGGMMCMGPGAKLDDGLLNISLIGELSFLEVLRCFPQLRKGEHVNHPKVSYGVGRVLSVETDVPSDVQMDGEVFGSTPVTFRVLPRVLQVLTPIGLESPLLGPAEPHSP